MKKATTTTISLVLALVLISSAQATLIDRGNGLIYDNVLNIMWQQDASLFLTNTFGVSGITAGGMNFPTANAWLAAMNAADYLGFNNWRLPSMDVNGNGTVVTCTTNVNCVDNELGICTTRT